jgi:hypothetical protein
MGSIAIAYHIVSANILNLLRRDLMIQVKGGSRKQKALAFDIASFCYNELIPRIQKCFIEINIKDIKGYEGTCLDIDEREYEIDINKKQSIEDFCVSICHEMVHVKQFVRKELYSDCIFYKTYEEYLNLPWEVEAYEKQEALFEKWKTSTNLKGMIKRNFFG